MTKLTHDQIVLNEERALRGYHALDAYMRQNGDEGDRQITLIDLLTDLMHYAHTQGRSTPEPDALDFDEALRFARGHFENEQKGRE